MFYFFRFWFYADVSTVRVRSDIFDIDRPRSVDLFHQGLPNRHRHPPRQDVNRSKFAFL